MRSTSTQPRFYVFFRTLNTHRANFFLSKQLVLLLGDLVWVFGTAVAENGNKLVTDLADV